MVSDPDSGKPTRQGSRCRVALQRDAPFERDVVVDIWNIRGGGVRV